MRQVCGSRKYESRLPSQCTLRNLAVRSRALRRGIESTAPSAKEAKARTNNQAHAHVHTHLLRDSRSILCWNHSSCSCASASMTESMGVRLSPTFSCSTRSTRMLRGQPGITCRAICRRNVVLPTPLRPMRPGERRQTARAKPHDRTCEIDAYSRHSRSRVKRT